MKLTEIEAAIEAILFISGEAVQLSRIAQVIQQDNRTTKSIIRKMMDQYTVEKRGIQIIEVNGAYQMCTCPQFFEYIKALYKSPQKQVLTQTLLETLAIIAYKQPITKAQIEEVRGVSSDHAINKLLDRNLIYEVGRMDAPGKPLLFGTTDDFLRYFGFRSIDELPQLHNQIMEQIQQEVQDEIQKED